MDTDITERVGGGGYQVPRIALLLHSFPRINLSFQPVNSTFNPHSKEYRESLMIWMALPLIVLLVTLIVFVIYFCYQCCKHTVVKKHRVPCLRWTIVALSVLSCATIGIGFYGNREAEKGLEAATGSISDALSTVGNIQKQIDELHNKVNSTIYRAAVRGLTTESLESTDLESYIDHGLRTSSEILLYITDIKHYVYTAEVGIWSKRLQFAQEFCHYRWLSLTILLTVLLALCILLFIGIARSSKCSLLAFSVFAAFSLVVCWIFTGIHLGIGLASSDYCIDPNVTFSNTSDPVHTEFVQYYLTCDHNVMRNPFSEHLQNAIADLKFAKSSLVAALRTSSSYADPQLINTAAVLSDELNVCLNLLLLLAGLVDCTQLHRDYISGLDGLCHRALPGVMFITLSVAAVALLFSALIIVASLASGRAHSRRRRRWHRASVSSRTDSFIADDAVADQSFSRRPTDPPPSVPLITNRSTPPPAYTSDGFYRQYSDFSPSEDSHWECSTYNARAQ